MLSRRSLLLSTASLLTLALPSKVNAAAHGRPGLASFVGFAAANFNMMPWGAFQQSTDFTSGFLLDGATITSGIASPDNQANAQKLVENSAGGVHRVYCFNNAPCSTSSKAVFRVAVIAKAAERTRIVVFCETYLNETAISASAGFDLSGGNTSYSNVAGTQTTIVATAMTAIGSGWYLCTLDYKYTGAYLGDSCVMQPKIYLDNGSGTAARSISYTGNGTSGINLWWLSLLPKAAWSINTLNFSEDFNSTSTIDLANTLDVSKKWFIRNYAPNSINPAWWSQANLAVSIASNFTASNSVLAINHTGTTWQSMMYSVGFPDAGGYIGNAWAPPMLFDSYMCWDNSLYTSPAYWGHAVEAMAGTLSPTAHWLEWDWIDSGATLSSVNDEYMNGATPVIINRSDSAGWNGRTMGPKAFHRLSGMWFTIALDGSTGMFMSFFDGQFVPYSDVAYGAAENQPPIVDANQVFLSTFETLHMPIMFDITSGGPMLIDWVKVYTN